MFAGHDRPGWKDTIWWADYVVVGGLVDGVRVGTPAPSLTPVSGMAAVGGLCERLGVVAAVGPSWPGKSPGRPGPPGRRCRRQPSMTTNV